MNASAHALRERFGDAVVRVGESCGDTIVWIRPERVREVLGWLKETADQEYHYLADITAVEFRDPERPLEVVYELFSLTRQVGLRVKAELPKARALEVESVYDLWRGADWLEREVYDMFGVMFVGHPDLRRILMWDTYHEGHPLRKDFPLRGRFSRSEQVRQALAANPEAHYSLEELSIAESYHELPEDMRERLARGERGRIRDPESGEDGASGSDGG